MIKLFYAKQPDNKRRFWKVLLAHSASVFFFKEEQLIVSFKRAKISFEFQPTNVTLCNSAYDLLWNHTTKSDSWAFKAFLGSANASCVFLIVVLGKCCHSYRETENASASDYLVLFISHHVISGQKYTRNTNKFSQVIQEQSNLIQNTLIGSTDWGCQDVCESILINNYNLIFIYAN